MPDASAQRGNQNSQFQRAVPVRYRTPDRPAGALPDATHEEHRALETALLEKGWVEFMDQLCNFAPAGSIGTIDGREIAIRYAWEADERDGRRRIFLATDEPMSLAGAAGRPSALADPFTFVELRIGPNGDGEGKLSEAARLSVDQTRDIIELCDYINRPLHLIKVQSVLRVAE
jgi:hypothetical protein